MTAAELLPEIRRVAALPDADALPAVEALLDAIRAADVLDEADWHDSLIADQLTSLRAMTDRLASQPTESLAGWEAAQLRQRAILLGPGEHPEERQRAEQVADEAEVRGAAHRLATLSREPLASHASLTKRLALVSSAADTLRRLGAMTTERETQARQAVELAARFRWQKKMDEAAVVLAGGNQIKAERLKREAAVMLQQDLARCGLSP